MTSGVRPRTAGQQGDLRSLHSSGAGNAFSGNSPATQREQLLAHDIDISRSGGDWVR